MPVLEAKSAVFRDSGRFGRYPDFPRIGDRRVKFTLEPSTATIIQTLSTIQSHFQRQNRPFSAIGSNRRKSRFPTIRRSESKNRIIFCWPRCLVSSIKFSARSVCSVISYSIFRLSAESAVSGDSGVESPRKKSIFLDFRLVSVFQISARSVH